jgi:hypothetical protein
MRSNFLKKLTLGGAVVGGIVLTASIVTFRAQADTWDKMTLLTVDQPTQVSDTYLEPGTYMFKLANSDRHIVQIFDKDRSHLINTIIAIPSYRVFPTSDTKISYWETPPGTAKAVRTWYYPGDVDGQEFRYPKNLRQIAAVTPLPSFAPQAPAAEETPAPAPAPVATEPEPPAPQALEQAPPPPAQEPVEIAQNTPPPSPPPASPAPAAAPAPAAQPEEQSLPKTASPYPLFGLGGLAALGLYAVLRIKRVA